MAMTYSSLIGAKGAAGAIATWVAYTRVDVVTIVDEAQSLIYSLLRCREMLTSLNFSMAVGEAHLALPARFLDPVGRIFLSSVNTTLRHKDSNFLQLTRSYTELSGTLGTDPFTTVSGETDVTVALAAHGFMQDSVFNTSGATAFNGVTINGTFPITAVETNSFTIDISSLGATPSASGAGGGSDVAYLCDNLTQGFPRWFAIYDEKINFDCAFYQQSLGQLQYYQSLPLLAATSNESNFLTNRYPQLMRRACLLAVADFMSDTDAYQRDLPVFGALVDKINQENDGYLRGLEHDTDTP